MSQRWTKAALLLPCLLTIIPSAVAEPAPTESTFQSRNADFDEIAHRYFQKLQPKIVNGVQASPGEFPWQVSLAVAWIPDAAAAHFCGGSLYDARWIVTAAHCLRNLSVNEFDIVAGVNVQEADTSRAKVARFIAHAAYDPATNNNDVALIELVEPYTFSSTLNAIPLLEPVDEPNVLTEGRTLTVSGWGALFEGGAGTNVLQKVDVPFVTRETCNDFLSYDGRITDNMICAGLAAGGKDSCQGDSGGPLIYRDADGGARLAGIVSWGDGCARPGRYGVYSRVANYADWIRACASQNGLCP